MVDDEVVGVVDDDKESSSEVNSGTEDEEENSFKDEDCSISKLESSIKSNLMTKAQSTPKGRIFRNKTTVNDSGVNMTENMTQQSEKLTNSWIAGMDFIANSIDV